MTDTAPQSPTAAAGMSWVGNGEVADLGMGHSGIYDQPRRKLPLCAYRCWRRILRERYLPALYKVAPCRLRTAS